MGVVQAVAGIITNTKIDYDCPGCGERVWAYPGFVGNRCWKCPGTLLHGVTRAAVGNTPIVSDIVDNVTNTTVDTLTDTRQYYHCPHCGKEKYAYGMFKGTTCWKCGAVVGTILDAGRKTVVDNTIKTFTEPKIINQVSKAVKYLSPNGLNKNDKIGNVKVLSVWLVHGCVAAPLSAVSGTLTNNSVTHWWVSIETYTPRWYCAMFSGRDLSISVHGSEEEVTEEGKSVLIFSDKDKNITPKHDDYANNKYMGDVVKFMQKYDGKYDLYDNNCQHFARALFKYLC